MAIPARLDEAPQTAGKRREPRRTLRLETEGSLPSGDIANVMVHNVSATGLLLESSLPLEAGDPLEIGLPHAGATRATVVWRSGKLYGCEFETQLSAAALSAAELRSAVSPDIAIADRAHFGPDDAFGERLKRLRAEKGLTMAQIAEQLGVSKPTVWAWEQGRAHPVPSRIAPLAQVLGVRPDELEGGRDTSALQYLLNRSRVTIAEAFGTSPDKVRILLEL